MKRLVWHRLVVVFLICWLPADQVLTFNVPICALQTDAMDLAMHASLDTKAQGGEGADTIRGCGDQGAVDCMFFTHCDLCSPWAVTPPFVLFHASPPSFRVLFYPPPSRQFDSDRIERPPRIVVS